MFFGKPRHFETIKRDIDFTIHKIAELMCDYSGAIVYIRRGVELSCFDYMNHMTPTFYLHKLETCPAASKNMKNSVFFLE